LDVKGTAVA